MAAMSVKAYVRVEGPLADGSAEPIIRDWMVNVRQDIAEEGLRQLRSFQMDKTGRATGHYQSQMQASNLSSSDIRIHNPVVYGPWLEGTSKRNRSTRFRGYGLWRKTAQRLQEDAPGIAEKRMPELTARLGGA